MTARAVNRALFMAAVLFVISGCDSGQVTPERIFESGTRIPMLLQDGELCQFIFSEGWRDEIGDGRTRLISPAVAPDGDLILITMGRFYRASDNEVFLANMESEEIRQLTHNSSDEHSAVWTPDGEWIVYGYASLHERGIFRMHRDGSDRERVVALFSQTIDVSPDGQYIAFLESVTDFERGDTLWRAPLDSASEPVSLLTDISGYMSSIAWSPDGTQIAFALQNAYDHDIAGLLSSLPTETNSLQAVAVVDKTDNVIAVRWSPDGEWLLLFVGRYSPGTTRHFTWYRVRPNGDEFSELSECNT